MYQSIKQHLVALSRIFGAGLISVFIVACGSDTNKEITFSETQANLGLDQVLNTTLQRDNIANSVLLVDTKDYNYRYLNAVGYANPDTQEEMTDQHPFRIASVSKTFVATIILQLIEEGHFTLDTPLSEILDDNDMPNGFILDDLHRFEEQSYANQITPRHLLQHTSGIRDFLRGGVTDDAPLEEHGIVYRSITEYVNTGSFSLAGQQWDSKRLLSYYLNEGYGNNAIATPGSNFLYSDSGYLLLGIIIEKVTASSLTNNLRQRIFDPLNLNSTYHDLFEEARGKPKAHHFFDLSLIGEEGNIDVEAIGANTSASWAGGGIVSTSEDLLNFYKALFNNELFNKDSTLAAMKTLTDISPNYGLGLQAAVFNDHIFYGHTGFWGVAAGCTSDNKICLAMSVNQVNSDVLNIGAGAVQIVLDAEQ